MSSTVESVMTRDVISVRAATSFKEMAMMLRGRRVSAFPVLGEDGKVIGMVSEADLMAKEAVLLGHDTAPGLLASFLHHRDLHKAFGIMASDLMTRPPITIRPDAEVTEAARLMYEHHVRHLPVVGQDGRLAGIVSRADVLSVYGRPDREIRHEIRKTIIKHRFVTDPHAFTVTVKDGVVTMEGTPESAAVGHDIIADVGHVEGVVAVRDHLSYPLADDRPVMTETL